MKKYVVELLIFFLSSVIFFWRFRYQTDLNRGRNVNMFLVTLGNLASDQL